MQMRMVCAWFPVTWLLVTAMALGCMETDARAAGWSADSTVNVDIATSGQKEWRPKVLSDGSSGAYVVYQMEGFWWEPDALHVRRINAAGVHVHDNPASMDVHDFDSGPVRKDSQQDRWMFDAVSDGAGGVFVWWLSGGNDVFVRKVNGLSVGPEIIITRSCKGAPSMATDGNGGVVIAWAENDRRTGLFAQRLSPTGGLMWGAEGVPVSTYTIGISFKSGNPEYPEYLPGIVASGDGGALVTWSDNRNDSGSYAQRLSASGAPVWTPDGVPVHDEYTPRGMVADGQGGAIVIASGFGQTFVAQRVNASGQKMWPAGTRITSAALQLWSVFGAISDNDGGVIVAWEHYVDEGPRIYAQRITGTGAVAWGTMGVRVCPGQLGIRQENPTLATDGAHGAIIAWEDYRNHIDWDAINIDIFAQRIDGDGACRWTDSGVPVCTSVDLQLHPSIVADGEKGAIVTWDDQRSRPVDGNVFDPKYSDIYGSRLSPDGQLLPRRTGASDWNLYH